MGHNYVGTEHLLLGLLMEGEGIAAHVLDDLGVSLEAARREIERLLVSTEPDELRPDRRTYQLGERVLDHDPEPPHRSFMPLLDRCSSAKREAEGFSAAIQELDLKTAVVDRSGLTD